MLNTIFALRGSSERFVQWNAKQFMGTNFLCHMVKKCLRHFMKNLRFFLNLFPSGEGISYKVKMPAPAANTG